MLAIPEIEARVMAMLQVVGAPGAAVAVFIDGKPWAAGIGHATVEHGTPLSAAARFPLYSVTKTILATVVMRLVETGALTLDDPIGAHVANLPSEIPVSIRHLLGHTGGVPDYGALATYQEAVRRQPGQPWTAETFLARTLAGGLLFPPGQGWRYSNIGYMLLRLMIERVTGDSFREVVRRYLSAPLGLHALGVAYSLEDVAALTPGYSTLLDAKAPPANITPHYHPGWVSHGLVASTAGDAARFIDGLFAGSIVGRDTLNEMLTPVPVGETHPWMTAPSYGLGLMMDPANRFGVVAGHTGGGPGYSAAAYHFPDVDGHRVTSVALVNRDGSDIATDIAFSMVEHLG